MSSFLVFYSRSPNLHYTRLSRTIDDGALFNVIVLIGSLIGTVIVVFTLIMRTLEEYCHISTSEPIQHGVDDLASSSSSSFESTRTAAGKVDAAETDSDVARGFVAGADGMGSGDEMHTLPDYGYVALHAESGNECGMEMKPVQSMRPSASNLPAVIAFRPRSLQLNAHGAAVPAVIFSETAQLAAAVNAIDNQR
jgi:hypothetical protein